MVTVLRLILFFAGAIIIVAFAVANRGPVVIEFFPLPFAPIQIPVYALLLTGMFIGALLGGMSIWLSSLSVHRENRYLQRQMKQMESGIRQERLREEEAAIQRSQRRKEREESDRDLTALPLNEPNLHD